MKSDKAICSRECGGRCCKASAVPLSAAEAGRLPALAQSLGLAPPRIISSESGLPFVMQASPCTFLNKSNLCSIYSQRPDHCRAFPRDLLEWCPLSWKRFGD